MIWRCSAETRIFKPLWLSVVSDSAAEVNSRLPKGVVRDARATYRARADAANIEWHPPGRLVDTSSTDPVSQGANHGGPNRTRSSPDAGKQLI
jgi:hypothetical protein